MPAWWRQQYQVFLSQYCHGWYWYFYHNGEYGCTIEAAGQQGETCKHLSQAWSRLTVVPEVIVDEDPGEDDEHDGDEEEGWQKEFATILSFSCEHCDHQLIIIHMIANIITMVRIKMMAKRLEEATWLQWEGGMRRRERLQVVLPKQLPKPRRGDPQNCCYPLTSPKIFWSVFTN